MAPEILSRKYDEKCDIWALGVIAYQLFSQGEYPFKGANEVQIFKQARRGKFYLPKPKSEAPVHTKYETQVHGAYDWENMSADAKDFIKLLLTVNPQKRPSA